LLEEAEVKPYGETGMRFNATKECRRLNDFLQHRQK